MGRRNKSGDDKGWVQTAWRGEMLSPEMQMQASLRRSFNRAALVYGRLDCMR
jgi:hypothetical protein